MGLASSLACAADGKPTINSAELALARDYVTAACIIDRYPSTPLAAEADRWANGLVERGNLPAQAYVELNLLARTAPPPLVSQDGTPMRLQGCIDFVNRPAFTQQLRRAISPSAKPR